MRPAGGEASSRICLLALNVPQCVARPGRMQPPVLFAPRHILTRRGQEEARAELTDQHHAIRTERTVDGLGAQMARRRAQRLVAPTRMRAEGAAAAAAKSIECARVVRLMAARSSVRI